MNTKQKLLVLTSTFPRWKDDTIVPFVYELSRRLTKDFKVFCLTPSYPDAKADEIMDEIEVHRFRYFIRRFEKLAGGEGILPTLKKNKWYYFQILFFMVAYFFASRKQVKKINPDVIHAHWIIPQGFIAALIKKIYGVKFLVTAHGGDVFGLQGRFTTTIKRFILKNADKITVVSRAIKKEILTKIDPNLVIEVISMGVNSERFSPNNKDNSIKAEYKIEGPFLLFVGRLTEKKGVKYLIEAMPAIIKEFPSVKLLIVGSGALEQELKNLTDQLHLKDNIFFTGQIANAELPAYYATSDIFIGPSIIAKGGDTEGLGLTFVEAAMSGTMTIASDVGGISDVIEDGITGFLVEQKSSAAISKIIIELLKDDSLIHQIKKQAREKVVSTFDWNIIACKYKEALSV